MNALHGADHRLPRTEAAAMKLGQMAVAITDRPAAPGNGILNDHAGVPRRCGPRRFVR